MTSTKRRLLLLAVTVVMVVSLAFAGILSAYAVTADDTVEYPFATGADAFKCAPTWKGPNQASDAASSTYVRLEVSFPAVSFENMKYIALNYKITGGVIDNFAFGVMSTDNKWLDTDAGWANEGKPYYIVKESGEVLAGEVYHGGLHNYVYEGNMLVAPVTSLTWRTAADSSTTKINRIFFTGPTFWNYGYSISIAEIGYYGEGDNGLEYHSLYKPTLDEEKNSYSQDEKNQWKCYADNSSATTNVEFPILGDYPFATGDNAFRYAPTWTGATEATDVMQSLTTPTVSNLSLDNVQSIAIQIKTDKKVKLIVSALSGSNRLTTVGSQGTVSFVSDNGTKSEISIADGYIEFEGTGALVIPKDCLTGTIASFNQIIFETNANTCNNFNITVGAIGYYGADDVYHPWYSIPNLASSSTGLYEKEFVAASSTVTHPTAPEAALKGINAKATYGDVNVYWNADSNPNGYTADAGGASGTVTIVKDSYDMNAAQVMATANDNNGYMAVNLLSANMAAEGTRGVTLWAKNPTNSEVSFNVEIDVRYKQTNEAVRYQRSRMNLKQGNRFWLYDVNTGEQTIYMTRPTATLPANFEGWIRIPYDCFNRADWSTGDPNFMFDNGVAKTDTFIVYLGLSYDTHKFPVNQPFVINNFGTYTTTPLFNSVLVSNADKTIPALMNNLPALPQVNEEVK